MDEYEALIFDLTRAGQWADDLMEDENQDRTLILEGLIQRIHDLTKDELKSDEHYTRMYTR